MRRMRWHCANSGKTLFGMGALRGASSRRGNYSGVGGRFIRVVSTPSQRAAIGRRLSNLAASPPFAGACHTGRPAHPPQAALSSGYGQPPVGPIAIGASRRRRLDPPPIPPRQADFVRLQRAPLPAPASSRRAARTTRCGHHWGQRHHMGPSMNSFKLVGGVTRPDHRRRPAYHRLSSKLIPFTALPCDVQRQGSPWPKRFRLLNRGMRPWRVIFSGGGFA